ncbi:hypothetical protein ACFQRK_04225 [Parapedobacter sp. GCM10030251]|uniref:hypothetical protein n=1 Tax=Parapedobacter sp. GCM10030251 TaxID=3273419 RepID=UPI00360E844F
MGKKRRLSSRGKAIEQTIRRRRSHQLLKRVDSDIPYWEITRQYDDNSPWGRFATTVRNSTEDIFALTILSSIGHGILSREQEWLKFPNFLSSEEKQILEYIDTVLSHGENPIQIVIVDSSKKPKKKDKPSKTEEVLNKIETLLHNQVSDFEKLKIHINKNTVKSSKSPK